MKTKIKAIGFDFDGTLVISEDKKVEEIAKVFLEKFNIKKGVKSAYKKMIGTGLNRHQKIEKLFLKFLKRKPIKKELKIIENHFGQHYQKALYNCPLFQCTNIIKELKEQVEHIFLLSLENKKEVLNVTKHCNLAKYFDDVLGGPKSKVDNLRFILRKYKLKPKEIIYIGDSMSDVLATTKMGIKIILINKKFNYEKSKKKLGEYFVFSNLCELPHNVENFK